MGSVGGPNSSKVGSSPEGWWAGLVTARVQLVQLILFFIIQYIIFTDYTTLPEVHDIFFRFNRNKNYLINAVSICQLVKE